MFPAMPLVLRMMKRSSSCGRFAMKFARWAQPGTATREAPMSKAVDRAAAQVYRGIWHGLVKWFKVPDEPPTLPTSPGEQLERFKPAEGFLRYLLLFFWIGLVIIDLIFLGIWLVSFAISLWLGLALLPVFLAVAILPDIVVYVAIHLRYDTTWYVLSDRSVRIRRGIWTITETTITFENVQDVKIDQGPIQRVYGISDIVIQTAGGGGASWRRHDNAYRPNRRHRRCSANSRPDHEPRSPIALGGAGR
jgi:membrane protein YdbS with pleckstrin-like domain